MDIERWRKRLETFPLGELYLYKEVDSTNTLAEKLAREGARPFSLVIADAQTAGRGRGGRTWITRPGQALAFSWILYPEPGLIQPETLGRLSGLGALAVAETLQDQFGLSPAIKWPNDVLVEGAKIAGILVEVHWEGCRLLDVILGVGINVHREALPENEGFLFPAITLEECINEKTSRLELLIQVLQRLLKWHKRLAEPSLVDSWNALLAYKNQQVSISSPKGIISQGELLKVDDDGALVLLSDRGELTKYHSGEIQIRLVDRS